MRDRLDSLDRRSFVALAGAGALSIVATSSAAARRGGDRARIRVEPTGDGTWHVTGTDLGLTERRSSNAPLILREGVRYIVVNDGWPEHPFELRDDRGNSLILQGGDGALHDDRAVDYRHWDDYPERVSFTLVEPLSTHVETYGSTADGSMEGDVVVRGARDLDEEDDEEREEEGRGEDGERGDRGEDARDDDRGRDGEGPPEDGDRGDRRDERGRERGRDDEARDDGVDGDRGRGDGAGDDLPADDRDEERGPRDDDGWSNDDDVPHPGDGDESNETRSGDGASNTTPGVVADLFRSLLN